MTASGPACLAILLLGALIQGIWQSALCTTGWIGLRSRVSSTLSYRLGMVVLGWTVILPVVTVMVGYGSMFGPSAGREGALRIAAGAGGRVASFPAAVIWGLLLTWVVGVAASRRSCGRR
jgi:hypothetical protein